MRSISKTIVRATRRVELLAFALVFFSGCKERSPDSAALDNDDGEESVFAPAEAPSLETLDQTYGAAYPPAYSKTWETNADGTTVKNPGLQICTPDHGLTPAESKLQIWAILENGTLVMGDEVVVGMAAGKKLTLGHPTLTGSTKARIAGELRWKDQAPVINNKSGRYSAHSDRGPNQLDAAARLFKSCGVTVNTKYKAMSPQEAAD